MFDDGQVEALSSPEFVKNNLFHKENKRKTVINFFLHYGVLLLKLDQAVKAVHPPANTASAAARISMANGCAPGTRNAGVAQGVPVGNGDAIGAPEVNWCQQSSDVYYLSLPLAE